MIIDSMKNAKLYYSAYPGLKEAFDFLEAFGKNPLPAGKHAIDGERLYAIVKEYTTAPAAEPKFESHDKYIDVQCVFRGQDTHIYEKREKLKEAIPYNAEKDCTFYSYEGIGSRLYLKEGDFAVYFPEDGHLPGLGDHEPSNNLKVIVKLLY